MPSKEFADVKITVAGGGSGPQTLEDAALDQTENVTSLVFTADNGGHTKEIRSVYNLPGIGDATQRIAIHVRNEMVRQLMTHRFIQNGQRSSTTQLAAAIQIAGTLEGGIELIEEAYTAHYKGKVIPVSAENVHLKIHYADGKTIIGEQYLDERKSDDPAIIDITYVCEDEPKSERYHPCKPAATQSTIEAIMDSDVYVVSAGSWHGSILALHNVEGIYEAMAQTRAKLAIVTNAVDFEGWTAQRYLQEFVERTGRKFDLALVTEPNHELPPSYPLVDNHHFVKYDKDECYKYAYDVKFDAFTHIFNLKDRHGNYEPTIRHSGPETALPILQLGKEARAERTRLRIFAAA